MTLTVPDTPDIETKIYENFKGCDYTNDPTNVWYRRSPSGVNMLPDASGRPFKRHGWEVMITSTQLAEILEKDFTEISKCYYFELAGEDHIIIFCEGGVFKYVGGVLSMLPGSDDVDCYASWDKAFFFEGDGESAFYIYGNYKFWVYRYTDDGYVFEQTNDVYVPKVLIGATADGAGTTYEAYNLAGDKAIAEYCGSDLYIYYGTDGLIFTVDDETFKTQSRGVYEFEYNGTAWELNDTVVTLSTYGITVTGTPEENDTIVVIYAYGVVLPSNVAQSQISSVKAYVSLATQFDKDLETVAEDVTPSTYQCSLHTDYVQRSSKQAFLIFSQQFTALTEGEDFIRVQYPVNQIDITAVTYSQTDSTGSAQIVT